MSNVRRHEKFQNMRYEQSSVLRIHETTFSQSTVRRHYMKWREQRGLPKQCDNKECQFHSEPLEWNRLPLSLILDHKSGNNCDNSPENLQLLCPNCDSLNSHTRGGANARRVERLSGGSYHVRNRDGTQDAHANVGTPRAFASFIAGAASVVPTEPEDAPPAGDA